MKVRDMMSTNVVTITEETFVNDAKKIMEAHRIRRLPVMKKDKLVGLVTKHMLLEAAPSPATSLNIWEMNYMLSKMTVKEVMVKNPFAISPDMPVEDALELGQEKGFGAFPVVEDGRMVGIVTESDIVRMMTRVLGVRDKGKKIDITASAQFGNMKQIIDILDTRKAVLLSLMTLPPDKGENDWLVMLRVRSQDAEPIAKDLEKSGFRVTYVG